MWQVEHGTPSFRENIGMPVATLFEVSEVSVDTAAKTPPKINSLFMRLFALFQARSEFVQNQTSEIEQPDKF